MNPVLFSGYYQDSAGFVPLAQTIAYMTAVGVPYDGSTTPLGKTGVQTWRAWDDFFHGIISDGCTSYLKCLYFPIWNSAALDKWNILDCRDLDAAFRLTWNGTWVHSNNQALPDGSTAFADPHFIPSSELSSGAMIGYYSSGNVDTNLDQVDAGVIDTGNTTGFFVSARYNASTIVEQGVSQNTNRAVAALLTNDPIQDARGYSFSNNYSGNHSFNKNGQDLKTRTETCVYPTKKVYFGACNNNGTEAFFTNRPARSFVAAEGTPLAVLQALNARTETLLRYFGIGTKIQKMKGDSFTYAIYDGTTEANRWTSNLSSSLVNKPVENYGTSGQSLTQNCGAASMFDLSTIPDATPQDDYYWLCYSFLNEYLGTVTSGKPGVPFANTPGNMIEDFRTAKAGLELKGYRVAVLTKWYMPSLFTDGSLVNAFANALVSECALSSTPCVTEEANFIANGGDSNCLAANNPHPNHASQVIIPNPLVTFLT